MPTRWKHKITIRAESFLSADDRECFELDMLSVAANANTKMQLPSVPIILYGETLMLILTTKVLPANIDHIFHDKVISCSISECTVF